MDLCRSVSEINCVFGRKRKLFLPSSVFNDPADGVPLEFYKSGGAQ